MTDKQTQNDLLPCPACKKPAMRLDRHPNLICCTDSKCMCGVYVYDEKMWNTRHTPQQISHDELVKCINESIKQVENLIQSNKAQYIIATLKTCKSVLSAVPTQQSICYECGNVIKIEMQGKHNSLIDKVEKEEIIDNDEIVERIAIAIDPQAFTGTFKEIHRYCSPYRIGHVQKKIREQAKAALAAVPNRQNDEKLKAVLLAISGRCTPEAQLIINQALSSIEALANKENADAK